MAEHDTADHGRRGFLRSSAGAIVGVGMAAGAVPSATAAAATQAIAAEPNQAGPGAQPTNAARPAGITLQDDMTTSDILVETLIAWGATAVFGMVGDGIAGVIEAIRKRSDRIRYVGVRHEEAAAFMASGHAKLTGTLGVCVGTTGPGAVHLLNGLYDAAYDGAPVVALTGLTFHDLIGARFIQALDTKRLMEDVALYNEQVNGPRHAVLVGNLACRSALGERGVAHLAIPKDVQEMTLGADKASMENHGARTSAAWLPQRVAASREQLATAAKVLNDGRRVAILVGQGALGTGAEVEQLAGLLGAPVAKALLGRNVIADDSPYATGGIGHLGTGPSSWIMQQCDTVLILGSTMPWLDFYPHPGQARGVQVDLRADRLGLRYPVEVGLVGDVRETLRGLLPLVQRKADRGFLAQSRTRVRDWNALLARIESSQRVPLRPQSVVRALSDALADDAIVTFDCGANTHFAARHVRFRAAQRLVSPGMLDTMAPGLPYAIAAQLACPGRQVVAIVGDGGFAMLMAELTTAVANKLPIKVLILDNRALAQVVFEQKEAGHGVFGTDLGAIDFVAFAAACGAAGFACRRPEEVGPAIAAALRAPGPAVIHAFVDPAEPTLKPDKLESQS
jgi:pyruvate dehydrogenase (quinone)/pyruvate decarboxylase